jgi:asparagine synthase (glutamine-hydrolysing)
VLLAAYESWGEECLSRLNGMFAFAVWDAWNQRLFAARDRFGEKPFYYVYDRQRQVFVFGSEIKALFASGLVDPSPDYNAVSGFISFFRMDSDDGTMFQGVRALPGAHSLVLSRSTFDLKVSRYWDLQPEAEVRLGSDVAYAERALELLSDAVRIRLRSDVPVGSSLSGGLDSSTIVGLVARYYSGARQAVFSARFSDSTLDEGRFIQAVCDSTPVESHSVYPDPARFCEEAMLLAWHQEEPYSSSSIYAQWSVMRLARDAGVTVLLDGQGADEVLAGYPVYLGAQVRGLCERGHFASAMQLMLAYIQEKGMGSLPISMASFISPSARRLVRRVVRPRELPPDFGYYWQNARQDVSAGFEDPLKEELYRTLTKNVLPGLLRYADRNSMAFSREVRLPFLDHRVVEYAFGIPSEQLLRGICTKFVLRNAVRGLVPEVVRTRKDKIGYEPPQQAWMAGPMRPWIQDLFFSRAFMTRPWIDRKIVDKTWRAFNGGYPHACGTLWKWLSLEMWARVFLDGGWRSFLLTGDRAMETSTSGRLQ